jgi:hypothetical protein
MGGKTMQSKKNQITVFFKNEPYNVIYSDDKFFYLENGYKIFRWEADSHPGVKHTTYMVDFKRKTVLKKLKVGRNE